MGYSARCAWIAALFPLVGCGGSVEETHPLRLDLSFHDTVADENDEAVPDVEVCVFDQPAIPCAVTDASGQYTILLPSGKDVILSYSKPDFFSKLRMVSAEHAKGIHFIWYFQRITWYQAITAELIGTADFGKAALTPQSTGVAGLKFTMDPVSGVGPMYAEDVTFKLKTLLTETSTLGVGAFLNVEDGVYTVTFHHPTKTCTTTASWAGKEPNSVMMQARGGYLTYVDLDCI